MHARSDEEVVAVVARVKPAPEVTTELVEAFARLCPDGRLAAVRSSAADDSAEHSFAGQLETFFFVTGDDLADRVAAVWRSGFSSRILSYRRQHGLESRAAPASRARSTDDRLHGLWGVVQPIPSAAVAPLRWSAAPGDLERASSLATVTRTCGTSIATAPLCRERSSSRRPHIAAIP